MRNFLLGFMYYLHKPKSIQTIQHLFGSGIFDVVGSGTLFLTNGQTSPIVTIAPGKSDYFKTDMANMNHLSFPRDKGSGLDFGSSSRRTDP